MREREMMKSCVNDTCVHNIPFWWQLWQVYDSRQFREHIKAHQKFYIIWLMPLHCRQANTNIHHYKILSNRLRVWHSCKQTTGKKLFFMKLILVALMTVTRQVDVWGKKAPTHLFTLSFHYCWKEKNNENFARVRDWLVLNCWRDLLLTFIWK